MLDTKELRIGNYVKYLPTGFSRVNRGLDIDILSGNGAVPIELSEDVLLKSGFVNSGNEGVTCYFRHLDTSICIIKEKNRYFFRYTDKIGDFTLRSNIIVTVEYLHQLQNLHYCLTGKELEIAI